MKTIQLEATRTVQKTIIRGVEFEVAMSPFDFPERLDCEYLPETGRLVVNFVYLDEEQSEVRHQIKGIAEVVLGGQSGRVQAVEFLVDELNLDQVKLRVSEGFLQDLSENEDLERPHRTR